MKKVLFATTALVAQTGIAFAPDIGIGSQQQPRTKSTGQKRDHSQGRPDVSSGSIASLNTGLPGMPRHGAALKAEMGAGSGGWTDQEAQIVGMTDDKEQRTAQIG